MTRAISLVPDGIALSSTTQLTGPTARIKRPGSATRMTCYLQANGALAMRGSRSTIKRKGRCSPNQKYDALPFFASRSGNSRQPEPAILASERALLSDLDDLHPGYPHDELLRRRQQCRSAERSLANEWRTTTPKWFRCMASFLPRLARLAC